MLSIGSHGPFVTSEESILSKPLIKRHFSKDLRQDCIGRQYLVAKLSANNRITEARFREVSLN